MWKFLHARDLFKCVSISDEEEAKKHRDTCDETEAHVHEGVTFLCGMVVVDIIYSRGGFFREPSAVYFLRRCWFNGKGRCSENVCCRDKDE